MATNQRPNIPHPSDLLSALLDKGYADATAQVLRSMARDTDSGILADRLKAFEEHAKELDAQGMSLSADDAYLRALMADFQDTLRKDATLIDAAAPDVQDIGLNAAGQYVRQTSLPGLSDAQLGQIGVSWNRPDPEVIRALVNYTTSDAWKAELDQYQTGISDQVREIAIRGIVAGQGPLTTARDVRAAMENIPAYRANSLLRTTQLESYRAAVAANQDANRDILEVQIRIAALDDRTCLACIALHGTEMPIGAPVDDHDNGRCTSITVLKGQTLNIQSGEDWFNGLSEDRQRAIAGPGAFEALKNNEVQLADFVQPYSSPIFGDMLRQAGLETARDNPNRTVQTLDGFIRADRGKPGNTEESLTAFVNRSDGPLARAFKDPEMALLELDFNTDQYTINTANVKEAAKRFVVESQDIQYGKDYILSLVQEEAQRNGMTITPATAERLYNQQFQYQAQSIRWAADIGDIRLTDAQYRRLQTAMNGDYLSMVYTTESSLAGSLATATKRPVTYGGNFYATDAARREARREFLDRMGRLDF